MEKRKLELPSIEKIHDSSEINKLESSQDDRIIWEDSEDVYQPIVKKLVEFQRERGIDLHQVGDRIDRVYIQANALDRLKKHLESNLRVEQGGILFGNAYQDPDLGIYVEITAAIAAPETIGTGVHLEFTSDSWISIMDDAKQKYPQANIVGWYHSHPNIGVFMSRTDMNTQEAFFYHPWCLSIVCDPVRKEIGFFLGKQAKLIKPYKFAKVKVISKQIEVFNHQDSLQSSALKSSQEELNCQENDVSIELILDSLIENKKQKNSLSKLNYSSIWILLLLMGLSLIVFSLPKIMLNNYAAEPSKPSLQVTLKTMPASVYNYLEKNGKELIDYPILQTEKQIDRGDRVALLVFDLQEGNLGKDGYLEVEKIVSQNSYDSHFERNQSSTINFDLNLSKENNLTKNKVALNIKKTQRFALFICSSKKLDRSDLEKIKSGKINLQDMASKLIYLPKKIIYKDNHNVAKEINIQEILGDEP